MNKNNVEIIDDIPLLTKTPKPRRYRKDTSRRDISIFQEELNWHLAMPGTPYFIARQRAIDNARRYTRRELPIDHLISLEDNPPEPGFRVLNHISLEISPDAFLLQEGNFIDANLSPESRALFNDLVRQLFTQFVKLGDDFESPLFANDGLSEWIATAYIARIIRVGNLEHILSDDLQEIVRTALGDRTPWTILDLSIICGYRIRKGSRLNNSFQKELRKIQAGLREFLQDKL